MRPLIILLAILLVPSGLIQAQAIITTVAGGGPDDVPALSANFFLPVGVAVDTAGNLFIADLTGHRVFKVDSTGQLTVVAGSGRRGSTGDGSPAPMAALDMVSGVAVDAIGNVFIADSGNRGIRRVDANTGIITTLPTGDGYGVAVDIAGNLFIADRYGHSVRRVDAATGVMTTVAGNDGGGFSGDGGLATEARLSYPWGVAVDGEGNLFIADSGNFRIRRVDVTSGVIKTIAGTGERGWSGDGGSALNARLVNVRGIAADANGNVYFTNSFDDGIDRVRRVDARSGMISTVAGTFGGFGGDGGPATEARLHVASGVAVDKNGDLFIADAQNQRVRRVDATTGIITTVAGNGTDRFVGDGFLATSVPLRPDSFAVDENGNLFIAVLGDHRVRRVDADTGIITTVAGNGEKGFSGDGGPATEASFVGPNAVAVDTAGNLFIADAKSHRIRQVDAKTGIITTIVGTGKPGFYDDGRLAANSVPLKTPYGVAVGPMGNLFIADTGNHRIRRMDAETGIVTTVAGNGATGGFPDGILATAVSLRSPHHVTLDTAGNLYLGDGQNHVLRVDAETGILTTVAGSRGPWVYGYGDGGPATDARFNSLSGVAVDRVGNLFIADAQNHHIRRVDAETGIITSVVGDPEEHKVQGYYPGDFRGDGGPAAEARLNSPWEVVLDKAGNLFIADLGNRRIRRVSFGSQQPVGDEPAEK